MREIEPHDLYELDVTIGPPWPNRQLYGAIMLDTGVEQEPTEMIRVRAYVEPRLEASRCWFSVPRQRTEELEFRSELTWSSDTPAGRVTGVSVVPPEMTAWIEEQEWRSVLILRVPPDCPPPPERFAYAVIVKTDNPTVELHVPIHFSKGRAASRPTAAATED